MPTKSENKRTSRPRRWAVRNPYRAARKMAAQARSEGKHVTAQAMREHLRASAVDY